MRRTSTLESTARMSLAHVFADAFLELLRALGLGRAVWKQSGVDIFEGVPASLPDDNLVVSLFPLEHRTRPDAELLSNLGRHRNLPLGCQPGTRHGHRRSLP